METVLHNSPLLTAAWFTPFAVGGMILAVGGGFVLHLIPNTGLMILSGCGFMLSVLMFIVIPADRPSTTVLYWGFVFPAMLGGTIGVDIVFNVTNVYITTAMPHRLQATASGLINSLLYLGISFWLGISELAVSTAIAYAGEGGLDLQKQYTIGFYVGVGLSAIVLILTCTIRMGQAEAAMTADEKAALEAEQQATQTL